MKKLILILSLLIPWTCHAGTRTSYFGSQGLVYISSVAFSPSIAYDSSTFSGFVSGSSPLTFSFKVGGARNRLLLVGCGQRNNDTISGITYAGNSLVLVTSTSVSGMSTDIYYLTNPPSGTNNVAVTAGSGISDRTACTAISYSAANQLTPVDISSSAVNTVLLSSAAAQVVTTVTNDALFDFFADGNNATPIPGTGQQPIVDSAWAGSFNIGSSSMSAAGIGTYTMGWAGTGGTPWSESMIAVQQSPTP